jgi:hypothetical protein
MGSTSCSYLCSLSAVDRNLRPEMACPMLSMTSPPNHRLQPRLNPGGAIQWCKIQHPGSKISVQVIPTTVNKPAIISDEMWRFHRNSVLHKQRGCIRSRSLGRLAWKLLAWAENMEKRNISLMAEHIPGVESWQLLVHTALPSALPFACLGSFILSFVRPPRLQRAAGTVHSFVMIYTRAHT